MSHIINVTSDDPAACSPLGPLETRLLPLEFLTGPQTWAPPPPTGPGTASPVHTVLPSYPTLLSAQAVPTDPSYLSQLALLLRRFPGHCLDQVFLSYVLTDL